jgi:catechol 2,3-dioxygenase-like lactoylglutathione lyase family enzyme
MESAAMVKDMAFVAYSVRDVPRAVAFYRDVLGLQPGESFGDRWVEFSVGATTFGVGNGESLGFVPGTSTGAAFEVDDIAALRDRLIAHDAPASELYEFPNCSAVFVTDPEGNRFSLHQRKS